RVISMMVGAVWVKKVQPHSKGVTYFGIAIGLWLLSFAISIFAGISAARSGIPDSSYQAINGLLTLGVLVFWIIAAFDMRSSIEEHFNSAEPIGLSLSGVMTFFFNVYYFQYHFTRINEMKRQQMTGYPA